MTRTGFQQWLKELKAHLDAFIFGTAISWVAAPYAIRRRYELERLFGLMTSASLMGLPCIPATTELRLLPYMMPSLLAWRRMTIFSGELEGVDLRHIGH